MATKNTIEREIHFYRADIGLDAAGKPKAFDPKPVFDYIKNLGWNQAKKTNQYYDNDGKVMGCWVYDTNEPCKITLGSIRRSDLPQVEIQGELEPLEIPEKAGLVEQTHIVFLGDNIVGIDSNFYGPRISRLPYYLSDKALHIAPEYIKFHPILQRDLYEHFKKFRTLNYLQLRVRASYADNIAQVNTHLSDALKAGYRAGETEDVEIVLRATNTSTHKGLSQFLLDALKMLSRRPELRQEAEQFFVKGYMDGKESMDELNLLSDRLIIRKNVRRLEPRSRALNPRAAFDAIISAYEEVKDEVRKAPSVEW